ncbi:MAG: rhomboid family intramembrane serine protease [Planctomycetes bacterium]|nr:rhomboid family intramembrane serine protease [Planctomycetota bacterium]MBI3835477.1 rhomboid family intramembrane serine protease [Planctomycetota bacterium]
MSWRDREYAGGASRWPYAGRGAPTLRLIGGSMVTTLIVINVAVFILCSMTENPRLGARSGHGTIIASPVFQWMVMVTPYVLHGEIWRIITAQFLHWDFGHIFVNMLALHFLGRSLENDWGSKRFLAIYLISGTLGMFFYMGLTAIGWLPVQGVLAGASGCILGLLGACAVRYPRAVVYLYFLFPVKIRTVALLFGGWYAFNLYKVGENAGGDACHLAGLLFGAWWAYRGENWWDRAGWRWAAWRKQPRRVRVVRADDRQPVNVIESSRVDEVLRKVYEQGIHSLSDAEKDILRTATEKRRTTSDRPYNEL